MVLSGSQLFSSGSQGFSVVLINSQGFSVFLKVLSGSQGFSVVFSGS